MWNEIKDFAAPELDVYARTSEVQLLSCLLYTSDAADEERLV